MKYPKGLTVSELIEILEGMPQDKTIFVGINDMGGTASIEVEELLDYVSIEQGGN